MPYFLVFKNIKNTSTILFFLLILFCCHAGFSKDNSKKNNKITTKHHKISKKHKAKKVKFILNNPKPDHQQNNQTNSVFSETDYFFEIELTPQNCNNTIISKCFFADSLFEKAYFHPTTLHIFSNKILATQLTYQNNNIQKSYPKIINKNYSFITNNHNKISFNVIEGNITDLYFSNTSNENKSSPCLFADKLFLHQQLYANLTTQDIFFKVPNKSELKQLGLFEYNQQKYAILYNNQNKSWQTIDNLILCQNKSQENSQNILWQKTFAQEKCSQKVACLTQKTTESSTNCQALSNIDLEICFAQEKCLEVFEINKCVITKNSLNE
jgi:hypothetical protein